MTTGTLVPEAQGGTGKNSYTALQLLVGNSTTNGLDKLVLTGGNSISVITVPALGTVQISLAIPSSTVSSGGTLATGGFVFVNTTTGAPITLTLSSALEPFILIKDIAGNANLHPITVSYSGGIDGGTTYPLALGYAWVWLGWNGTDYSIIG